MAPFLGEKPLQYLRACESPEDLDKNSDLVGLEWGSRASVSNQLLMLRDCPELSGTTPPLPVWSGRGAANQGSWHITLPSLCTSHEVQTGPDKVPTWNFVLLSPTHVPQRSLASGGGHEAH